MLHPNGFSGHEKKERKIYEEKERDRERKRVRHIERTRQTDRQKDRQGFMYSVADYNSTRVGVIVVVVVIVYFFTMG